MEKSSTGILPDKSLEERSLFIGKNKIANIMNFGIQLKSLRENNLFELSSKDEQQQKA